MSRTRARFKPLLAASVTDTASLRYPLLASPKLDGVRCLIVDGVAMTRSLHPIPNRYVQRLFGKRFFDGLDGELIVDKPNAPDAWQRTSSAVMSRDGEPNVRFHVFDNFLEKCGFGERLESVMLRVKGLEQHGVIGLRHIEVKSEHQLLVIEEEYLQAGFEGVMLRAPNGPYKYGRSTLSEGYLLKLKRFEDGEAVVLAVAQLLSNRNEPKRNALGQLERSSHKAGKVALEKMGALHVRDLKTGITFDIGTGFTEEQRIRFWCAPNDVLGKVVRYKYQPTGIKERPRFPVFLGIRDGMDL